MSGIECPIECCQKDSPDWIKANETFVLTIVATISGIIGLLLNTCIKSRCSEIKCFGLFCKREPLPLTIDNNENNENNNTNNI
tara:strand:+ start:2428 stop:2676 length:249 start_codon:yes stop_codon:yes gene_type:complete